MHPYVWHSALQTRWPFAFSSNTGQLAFFPNMLQRAVVVYHIQEYRAGVLVGLQRSAK